MEIKLIIIIIMKKKNSRQHHFCALKPMHGSFFLLKVPF